ncbi:ISL3 family transposase, partial [Enterococcus sp. BWB1-3]|uniref:ISL3 family transposase n=1 Tax=Enterococcus sp. BWB1-3 TaxID=2787713 RepID=UPI001924ECDB
HSFRSPAVCPTRSLPEVLCFDEFKSVKNVSAAMSFVMMDGQSHQLLDIAPNRQLSSLRTYFSRYSIEERAKVRLVVTDFYTPYRTLVKECFPHAHIVADRFHIAQHIARTFLKHRIQRMKQFRPDQFQYKQLKRYWRLLQKNAWSLDYTKSRWHPSFRAYLTESELVDRLLGYDEELNASYQLYQSFLSTIKHRDVALFCQLLRKNKKDLPEVYHTPLTTFRKYKQEIKRALRVPYSNGPLECLNNHSKVLKRISYGFRNFNNFRERIFLYRGTYFKEVKKNPH